MPSVTAASFIPDMQALPPLSIPGIVSLPSMTGLQSDTVNSIASSIQAKIPPERCSSRNSYSPAMSDSGISVDTGSTSSNNSGLINLTALAKLGTISVNAQGADNIRNNLAENGRLVNFMVSNFDESSKDKLGIYLCRSDHLEWNSSPRIEREQCNRIAASHGDNVIQRNYTNTDIAS